MDAHLQINERILFGWTDYVCHVGESRDYMSILKGFITTGIAKREREWLLRGWDMRRTHNTIHWFDLKLAQNKRLEFWQTISNTVILYGSLAADCVVRVIIRNPDDVEAEILYQKETSEWRETPREAPVGEAPRDEFRRWTHLRMTWSPEQL